MVLPEYLDDNPAAQRPDKHEQHKLPELQIETEQASHAVGSCVVADRSFIHLKFRVRRILVRVRGFFVRAHAHF
jgi:hypothetical protein